MAFKKANTKKLFIGRTNELNFFIESVLKPAAPLHNIIAISGQGGVGKTTLINHFIDTANLQPFKNYCLTALVNEHQVTPSSVMEKFAEQLSITGKFEKELKQYKDTLRKARNNQESLQTNLLRKMATNVTGSVVKTIPVAGDILEKEIEPVVEYVFNELQDRQIIKDAERLEDPLHDLTNAFIYELNSLTDPAGSFGNTKRMHRVILFIDTFEHLAPEISPWLLNYFLLSEVEINYDVILVIAGRDPIERSTPDDPKQWLSYRDDNTLYLTDLNSLNEDETRLYLLERGIQDQDTIRKIWHLSKGLPLYLSLLTFNSPGNIDPTTDVVANFLRWLPEQEHVKRQLALDASMFSKSFNQDDLEAFAYTSSENNNCASLYEWLIRLPFVKSTQDGRYSYHELAQEMFRRRLYQKSQKEYYKTCQYIANYYDGLLNRIQAEQDDKEHKQYYLSERLDLTLALAYQLLSLPDEVNHSKAIDHLLTVYHNSTQKEALIRLLREFLQTPNNILMSQAAQEAAEMLLLYIEANLRSLEFLQSVGYLLAKAKNGQLFSKENLFGIYSKCSRSHIASEEYRKAIIDLNKAIELNPEDSSAYHNRGLTYANLQEHQQALADFTRAIEFDPAYFGAYNNRGLTYANLQEHQQALADFTKAIEFDPQHSSAYNNRGLTYRDLQEYQQALADFTKAIKLDPEDFGTYYNRGLTYRDLQEHQQALADFTKAIELNPQHSSAYHNRGLTYRDLQEYQQALADFTKAIKLDPAYFGAYNNRGLTYANLQEHQQALADFTKAIELNPQHSSVYYNRGLTYRDLQEYQQALADFTKAIELNPAYFGAYNNRGLTYRDLQEYQQALADFTKAIELNPQHSSAYHNRGLTHRDLQEHQQALADFTKAIELNPEYAAAYNNRSEIFRIEGNYKAALTDIDYYIALNKGSDHSSYNERGLLLSYLHQYEEAIECYEKSLKVNPNDYYSLYNKAVVIVRWKGLSYAQASVNIARAALLNIVSNSANIDEQIAKFYGLGGLEALADNTTSALKYLRRAISFSKKAIHWARHDIAWTNLRTDPYFQSMVPET